MHFIDGSFEILTTDPKQFTIGQVNPPRNSSQGTRRCIVSEITTVSKEFSLENGFSSLAPSPEAPSLASYKPHKSEPASLCFYKRSSLKHGNLLRCKAEKQGEIRL